METTSWLLIIGGAVVLLKIGSMYAKSSSKKSRAKAYEDALAALAREPGNRSLRVQALAAGRAHYGGMRPDGSLTIYDEQAISNDISAHGG